MVLPSFSWQEFQTFPFQVAFVLFLSILIPLFTSSVAIAHERPFVILSAVQAKRFHENENEKRMMFGFLKGIIIFLFPFIPAIVVISGENAMDKIKTFNIKGYRIEDLNKAADVDEFKCLTRHIDETRL